MGVKYFCLSTWIKVDIEKQAIIAIDCYTKLFHGIVIVEMIGGL